MVLCLPRMRGDRPCRKPLRTTVKRFTPHARGSTLVQREGGKLACVYPACAGIDRTTTASWCSTSGLPRMRGDRPSLGLPSATSIRFTPHARGSTLACQRQKLCINVYPACAGIDPNNHFILFSSLCLPRMRGDRPSDPDLLLSLLPFTPHARGSTVRRVSYVLATVVYPACAGIDLSSSVHLLFSSSLPRMRGDRPQTT